MRFFIKTILVSGWVLFGSCQQQTKEELRPNIIFIMSDDHASQALSCYGSGLNQTPNLDRLAKEGALFNNCFVTNSICAPSRASIITGKYSHKHGKIGNRIPFNGDQLTFPKLLQKAGYETAMIGKWHLDPEPQGFDFWKILTGWMGQGHYYNPEFNEMGELKTYKGYVTNLTTNFAIDWIRERNTEKPFCLLYQHKAPHGPWYPDTTNLNLYDNEEIPVPVNFFDNYENRSEVYKDSEGIITKFLDDKSLKTGSFDKRLNEDQRKKFEDAYYPKNEAMEMANLSERELALWKYQRYIKDYLRTVKSVDDNVGQLLDFLDENNLTENTIVIYTSDQGFFLGEHGFWDKRLMLEESLRMPFLIRYPKKLKASHRIEEIILNIDFAPTLLDFAGVDIPEEIQGESFKPLLEGKVPENWRKSMYYQYYEYPGWHMVKRHYGIRTERYKLIHYYYDIDVWQLFDLENDPNEMVNVYNQPEYEEVVEKLKKELSSLRKKYGDSNELNQQLLKDYPGFIVDIPNRTNEYPQFDHLKQQ